MNKKINPFRISHSTKTQISFQEICVTMIAGFPQYQGIAPMDLIHGGNLPQFGANCRFFSECASRTHPWGRLLF